MKLRATGGQSVSLERLKGVAADARALGVSKGHLSRVLSGKRLSKRLTDRYKALKETQAREAERST